MKEGPAEYFPSRMTNKERKKTLVDELLVADEAFRYAATCCGLDTVQHYKRCVLDILSIGKDGLWYVTMYFVFFFFIFSSRYSVVYPTGPHPPLRLARRHTSLYLDGISFYWCFLPPRFVPARNESG